jgi:hypothetical protein
VPCLILTSLNQFQSIFCFSNVLKVLTAASVKLVLAVSIMSRISGRDADSILSLGKWSFILQNFGVCQHNRENRGQITISAFRLFPLCMMCQGIPSTARRACRGIRDLLIRAVQDVLQPATHDLLTGRSVRQQRTNTRNSWTVPYYSMPSTTPYFENGPAARPEAIPAIKYNSTLRIIDCPETLFSLQASWSTVQQEIVVCPLFPSKRLPREKVTASDEMSKKKFELGFFILGTILLIISFSPIYLAYQIEIVWPTVHIFSHNPSPETVPSGPCG